MDKELKEFLETIKKNQEDQKLVLSALEERTRVDSAEIKNIKNRFDKMDASIENLKEEIKQTKEEVKQIKEEVKQTKKELKEDIKNTEVVLSKITSAINQDIAQIKEKFEDIREDVDVLDLKTDSNTKKIKRLISKEAY